MDESKYSRRSFLKTIGGASIASVATLSAQEGRRSWGGHSDFSTDLWEVESQYGDPSLTVERFEYEKDAKSGYFGLTWDFSTSSTIPKQPRKNPSLLRQQLVKIASEFADQGVSRTSAPYMVKRYLKIFGLDIIYPNGRYVPYCAAGLMYSLCKAYARLEPDSAPRLVGNELRRNFKPIYQHYILPSPSVRDIKADAVRRGIWSTEQRQKIDPGHLVIFSWSKDKTPNHIGIVLDSTEEELHSVEFNTSIEDQRNGGCVAFRKRKRNRNVLGYVQIT